MGRPANLAIRLTVDGGDASREDIEKTILELNKLGDQGTALSKKLLIGGAVEDLALALLPVAAAATAAGAGLAAMGLAVLPQVKNIEAARQTWAKYQQELQAGSKSAAATLKQYNAELAAMPPATRDAATAVSGLSDGFKKWSDSMAPEVMPIFTQAVNGLKESLPALTPLVHAAAQALAPFVAEFENAAKNGSILKFSTELSKIAGPVLSDLLKSARDFGKGFGNVLLELGPDAEKFSAKLADWGAKFRELTDPLGKNKDGMSAFATEAGKAADTLGPLIEAIGHIVANTGPLADLTLKVANAFAQMILSIPTPALQIMLPAVIGITAAIKGFQVALVLAEVAQAALNVEMDANPIALIILAIAGLVLGLTYLWNHCKLVRDIFGEVWSVIKTGIELWLTPLRLAFDLVKDAIGYLIDKGKEFWDWLSKTLHVPDAITQLKQGFTDIRDAIQWCIDKVEDFIKKLGSIGKSAVSWIPGLGRAAEASGFGFGTRGYASGDQAVRTLVAASPIALAITIDGQQLQARISRTVNGAMRRDGARLAAAGWA
jgi:phage-related protein